MNWLRYLGRQARILALYDELLAAGGPMHPIQLSRATGLDMFEVQQRLETCTELFVRLPRNTDGLVRWRLTSSATAMTPEEVHGLIKTRARTEQLQITAGVVILASFALVLLMTIIPATSLTLD